MNAYPDHGINDPDIGLGEDQRLPTAEAVLAATLALMTGHAQACCEEHRRAMLTKIVANLHLLANHPGVSPGFRTVAVNLYAMWARLRQQWQEQEPSGVKKNSAQPGTPPAAKVQPANTYQPSFTQPRVLWQASSEILQ